MLEIFPVILCVVTHLALQLVGLLGTKNLWSVPDKAANTLHPVQVILVEHLLNVKSKKHKFINGESTIVYL